MGYKRYTKGYERNVLKMDGELIEVPWRKGLKDAKRERQIIVVNIKTND